MWIELTEKTEDLTFLCNTDFIATIAADSDGTAVLIAGYTGNEIRLKESYEKVRRLLVPARRMLPDNTGAKLRAREEFFKEK